MQTADYKKALVTDMQLLVKSLISVNYKTIHLQSDTSVSPIDIMINSHNNHCTGTNKF